MNKFDQRVVKFIKKLNPNVQTVNFIVVRHGQGCHNAVNSLVKRNEVPVKIANRYGKKIQDYQKAKDYIDPELSHLGVDMTMYNANALKKELKHKGIEEIHFVMSSGLLRAIETAYLTKQVFEKGDQLPIHVVPYLREIDEKSNDVKLLESKRVINEIPLYAMKPLDEQKKYLKEAGILSHVIFNDDSFRLRDEPGSISDFIEWLEEKEILKSFSGETINILIVSHGGVMSRESKGRFYNNTGFMKTFFRSGESDLRIFDDYEFSTHRTISYETVCPDGIESNRCNPICENIKNTWEFWK